MEHSRGSSSDASLGIASIAKSVTTLAKAVSDLQKQMKDIDQRLAEQEATSSLILGNNARKKKNEFLKAYKAVMSIVKTLKVMPEIQEHKEEMDEGEDQNSQVDEGRARGTTSSQLLRSIAQTLSDMETVASYVTQEDEVSTAEASTLSRPADYVKIEEQNGIPNNVDVKPQHGFGDIETLKQILNAKDEQMQKLMEETKLQTQLLQTKNNRWGLANLASMLLLLGGVYIGNNYDFHQSHLHVNNFASSLRNDEPVVVAHNNSNSFEGDMHVHKALSDGNVKPVKAYVQASSTNETYDAELYGEKIQEASDVYHESDSVASLDTSLQFNETKSPESVKDDSKSIISGDGGDNIVDTGKSMVEAKLQDEITSSTLKRGWLEESLCDELSDMMICDEKKPPTSVQGLDGGMHHIDRAAMNKMMIRRQVFTAISVAVAMTLPKIAPHIFKLNLAQVLSLSFWRSVMEFLTVLIQ